MKSRLAFLVIAALSQSALAAPLSRQEQTDWNRFCQGLFKDNKQATQEKKDAFCACFIKKSERYDATTRRLILLGAEEKKDEMIGVITALPMDKQMKLQGEMETFQNEAAGCAEQASRKR